MPRQTYTAKIWGESYSLRADFGSASSRIERDDEDGGWGETGRQVADYSHSPELAMRAELEQSVTASGDDPEELHIASDIYSAIEKMTSA